MKKIIPNLKSKIQNKDQFPVLKDTIGIKLSNNSTLTSYPTKLALQTRRHFNTAWLVGTGKLVQRKLFDLHYQISDYEEASADLKIEFCFSDKRLSVI